MVKGCFDTPDGCLNDVEDARGCFDTPEDLVYVCFISDIEKALLKFDSCITLVL